jgi:transposase InsO family protein
MPFIITHNNSDFCLCPSDGVGGDVNPDKHIFEVIADEVMKPARRTYPRRAVISKCPDDIWSMDLADFQSLEDKNDGYKYTLNVVDVFSRYAWAVPIKNKVAKTVLDAFKSIVADNKDITPSKLWIDQGGEFTNNEMQKYCKAHKIEMYHTFGDSKSVIVERFNRTLKTRLSKEFIAKNSHRWIDMLDAQMKNYNTTIHRSIKMTPTAAHSLNSDGIAKLWAYQYGTDQTNPKPPKFKVGDFVRLNRVKGTFEKGYNNNWSMQIYQITEALDTVPWTYKIKDTKNREIEGSFYEPELQKTQQNLESPFLIEKELKRRTYKGEKQVLVKYLGYDDEFNEWIPDTD